MPPADGWEASAGGGWGYQWGGAAFTEPTGLGLMAVSAAQASTEPALTWLLETQRRDGGWGALRGDSESGWQTSLAVWALGMLRRSGAGEEVAGPLSRGAAWTRPPG